MTPAPTEDRQPEDDAVLAALIAAYALRLRRARRPAALIVAYTLLARALRDYGQVWDMGARPEITTAVSTASATLAVLVARYVTTQVGSALPLAAVVAPFQHAVFADAALAARDPTITTPQARAILIATARTQLLTASLTQQAVTGGDTRCMLRAVNSSKSCAMCQELAGTYTAPYPARMWASHPNCACSWQAC